MPVIGAIRDGRAFGQTRKIMDVHLLRLPLLAPFPPVILEVPDPLLLLRVYGDHRFFALQEPLSCLINVAKLPVPVGVGFPLFVLPVRLQRVIEIPEPPLNGVFADCMTLACHVLPDLVRRLTAPLQRRHRVAHRAFVHHLLQHSGKVRITLFYGLPSSPGLPHSSFLRSQVPFATKFADTLQDGWLGKTALLHHSLDTTSPQSKRLPSHQPTPLRLVKSPQNLPEQALVLPVAGRTH